MTPKQLLERYVEAKDLNRPHLMHEIYTLDAVLTYSIATDEISFPSRSEGAEAIKRTLVIDFAKKFVQCKTYYLCDAPPKDAEELVVLPWLVLMREPAASCLRAGKGFYRWTFTRQSATFCVSAMHIHIERMDPIPDSGGGLLRAAQASLSYPWLTEKDMRQEFERLIQHDKGLGFLKNFTTPASAWMS